MEHTQPPSYESLQRAPQDFDECFELHEALNDQIIRQTAALKNSITRREYRALRQAHVNYSDVVTSDSIEHEVPAFLQQIGGDLLPHTVDRITTLEALHEQQHLIDARINNEYTEDLATLVAKKARDILNRTDSSHETTDVNQEVLYDGTMFTPSIATLMAIVDQVSRQESVPMTVERADSYLAMIAATETHFAKVGLLHDPPSEHSMPELRRAEELMRKYRHGQDFSGKNPDGTPDDKTIATAQRASRKPILPIHDWAVTLEADQRESLYDHLRSVNGLEGIVIEGLKTLPFTYTSDDVVEVLRQVPGIALEGVDWIIFETATNRKSNGDPDLWGGKNKLLGHHDHFPETNSAEIVVWVNEIHAKYNAVCNKKSFKNFEADAIKRIAEQETRLYIAETLLHEAGHGFHHTLPVALLDHWDTLVQDEDVSVSSYVHETKRTNHIHRHLEDFADTFRLYFEDPHFLQTVAPQRFLAMRDLVAATTYS